MTFPPTPFGASLAYGVAPQHMLSTETVAEKNTIAGLISRAAKRLHDDFENIRETVSHSGEKGGETEDKVREFLNVTSQNAFMRRRDS
jgi:hypothetical protein